MHQVEEAAGGGGGGGDAQAREGGRLGRVGAVHGAGAVPVRGCVGATRMTPSSGGISDQRSECVTVRACMGERKEIERQ